MRTTSATVALVDNGRGHLEAARSAIDAAYAHIEAGHPERALALTAPLAQAPTPAHAALVAHAQALKALGRPEEALACDRRAAQLYSQSPIAWHNLGATAGDLERTAEARQALERALAMGLDGPETLQAYARTLQLIGETAMAERAFRLCLQRRPDDAQTASELAELLWTTTADIRLATAPLAEAMMRGADEEAIAATLIQLYEIAGRRDDLRTLFDRLLVRHPDHAGFLTAASRARLMDGELDASLALIDRSLALDPRLIPSLIQSAAVRLASGRIAEALDAARTAREIEPDNQAVWGWLATCARAAGEPEYESLFDYDAFVRPYMLDTPEGWDTLDSFLGDLASSLRTLHRTRAEPLSQSVRGGSQTLGNLAWVEHPVVQAFFRALERPILKYMRDIGASPHPFLARNTGRYRIQSAWSVRLRGQGRHSNHYHPMGWISSAFYVTLPPAAPNSREGWIQFGEPPHAPVPPQPPGRFVEPTPGMLVLFPSYMWHGTVPFSAEAERLTIAFDAVPA